MELQQFSFPAAGGNGGCKEGKMTISSVVGGRVESMQDICGHKEGVEGRIHRILINFTTIQIPVLIPVHGLQAVVLSAHHPLHTRAEWRVKASKEKCGNIGRRMLGKKRVGITHMLLYLNSSPFQIWETACLAAQSERRQGER